MTSSSRIGTWKARQFGQHRVACIDLDEESIENRMKAIGATAIEELCVELALERVRALPSDQSPLCSWARGSPRQLAKSALRCLLVRNPPGDFVDSHKRLGGDSYALAGSETRITRFAGNGRGNLLVSGAALRSISFATLGVVMWARPTADSAKVYEFCVIGLVSFSGAKATLLCPDSSGGDFFSLKQCVICLDAMTRAGHLASVSAPDNFVAETALPSTHLCIEQRMPGAVNSDSAPSFDQLLSFAISWHVVRSTPHKSSSSSTSRSFFENVVLSPDKNANDEKRLDLLLRTRSFVHFREAPPRIALFGNCLFLRQIIRLMRQPELLPRNRRWLREQYTDAFRFLVHSYFIENSPLARSWFVEHFVLGAARRVLRQAGHDQSLCTKLAKIERDRLPFIFSVDFIAVSALRCNKLVFPKIGDVHDDVDISGGIVYMTASAACKFGIELFATLLELVEEHSNRLFPSALERQYPFQVAVDELPRSGSRYSESRTGVPYDDVHFGSQEHRALRPIDFPDAALAARQCKTVPLVVTQFNLAKHYGRVGPARGGPGKHSLPVRGGGSVQLDASVSEAFLRTDSQQSRVAAESSTSSVCNGESTNGDIEDFGEALLDRACMPLCGRVMADRLVRQNKPLRRNERFFYYRWMRSLELDELQHQAISAHMLRASTGEALVKHRDHVDNQMPRAADAALRRSSDWMVRERGLSREAADAQASHIGSCSTLASSSYSEHGCPYAHMTKERLQSELQRLSPENFDKSQIGKILELVDTKNYSGACMTEYTASRRAVCASEESPLINIHARFTRPRHYVQSAIDHWSRVSRQKK